VVFKPISLIFGQFSHFADMLQRGTWPKRRQTSNGIVGNLYVRLRMVLRGGTCDCMQPWITIYWPSIR